VRTDKESELIELLSKDERFRGMMELYGLFRELIAYERISSDKSARMATLGEQLTDLQNKMVYVDEALSILVKHMVKADATQAGPGSAMANPGAPVQEQ